MLALALLPLFSLGCVVGQKPGKGQTMRLQEPSTGGWYWLYLPEEYVKLQQQSGATGKNWPLVVTFHGMKPFDNANRQIREWQQEADRYGYVVIAPELASPDLLKEFPLKTISPSLKNDDRITIAAMDDVAKRVDLDPSHVLSTSWSSGGYVAHFMANRYPQRFSCIAPRQSNFSAAILDPDNVNLYRDNKVAIFYTENDFAVCQRESQEGAVWYSRHGFDVKLAVFQDLGHERRPGASAAFFAKTCGAVAKTPPSEIARMQVKEIPQLSAAQAGSPATASTPRATPGRSELAASAGPRQPAQVPNYPLARSSGAADPTRTQSSLYDVPRRTDPVPVKSRPVPTTPSPANATPPRAPAPPPSALETPLRVRVSSTIGISPLRVSFNAIAPERLRRGAFFLWTDNGVPISNDMNGQKYLTQPGDHLLEVLMTTADGAEYRARSTVTVLKPVGSQASASSLN